MGDWKKENFTFLFLLLLFGFLPFCYLWVKNRRKLARHKKVVCLSLFASLFFGGLWQHLAVENGVWGYSDKILGLYLFGIPLEEHLFDLFFGGLIITLTLLLADG